MQEVFERLKYRVETVGTRGRKYYNSSNQLHREEGPAVILDSGSRAWYQHGKRHRIDGPAIVFADGVCTWFLNGEMLNEREYVQLIESGNYLEPQ